MTQKSFSDGFFEDRGWLGIVQHDSTNGLNVAGTPVTYESVTLAEFQDAGFDLTVERTVYVSDVPSDRSLQGGSFWRIVPTATVKRKLISEAVCYSTFAAAIAAFPIASYNGLRYRCGDVGDYRILLESNGTRVKPESGIALLGSSAGNSALTKTLAGLNVGETSDYSTLTGTASHTYTNVSKKIPGGLLGSTDIVEAIVSLRKSGSAGAFTPVVSIGTTNVIGTDSVFYDIAAGAGSGTHDIEIHGKIKFVSATAGIAKRSNEVELTAGIASRWADRSTALNTAGDMYINVGIGSKNNSDTIYLLDYQFIWKAV